MTFRVSPILCERLETAGINWNTILCERLETAGINCSTVLRDLRKLKHYTV